MSTASPRAGGRRRAPAGRGRARARRRPGACGRRASPDSSARPARDGKPPSKIPHISLTSGPRLLASRPRAAAHHRRHRVRRPPPHLLLPPRSGTRSTRWCARAARAPSAGAPPRRRLGDPRRSRALAASRPTPSRTWRAPSSVGALLRRPARRPGTSTWAAPWRCSRPCAPARPRSRALVVSSGEIYGAGRRSDDLPVGPDTPLRPAVALRRVQGGRRPRRRASTAPPTACRRCACGPSTTSARARTRASCCPTSPARSRRPSTRAASGSR